MTDEEMTTDEFVNRVAEVVGNVSAILHGEGWLVQGAALADLTAMWLAGHMVPGDDKATDKIRERTLTIHVEAIRGLIPVNVRMMMERERNA